MKTYVLILSFAIVTNLLFGQPLPSEYFSFIKKADSLYKAKDYKNSALAYSSAFKSYGWKATPEDRYNAARSWALANNADSAFYCLERLVKKNLFTNSDRMVKEGDFNPLHSDKRWDSLLALLKDNKGFNFGFEKNINKGDLPIPWFQWGTHDYVFRVDSTVKHGGKYSMLMEPTEDITQKSFGCVAYAIPADYEGKEIEVKAYVKMENVERGIGLMLRIDGKELNKSLGFDNMMYKNIIGTKDWTLYSVKLLLPKEAVTIYIGTILSGTGKLWSDDFQVLIDGKDISETVLKKH
ncbi:MAG: hypothetical protein HY063_13965 [Bacteroidetes bacterium]|nr:hypothetical protein [Bacteroidota bacterium]